MKKTLSAFAVALVLSSLMSMPASAKTISVTSFGAKANDKKDDTAAIQKAIDRAPSGATVTIPKGTFYSQQIYLRRNITLKASKKTIMKKKFFAKHPENAFIVFHPLKKGYTGFSKVTIEGGTWDGGIHKDNAKNYHKGIEVDHGHNLKVKNMTWKNFSGMHIIEVNAVKNATIDHINISNHYLYTGKKRSQNLIGGLAIEFDSAIKGQGTSLPNDNTVCTNITVSNCQLNNVLSGIGSHHNEPQYYSHMHKNFTVKNNMVNNVRGDAIELDNIKKVTCSGNTGKNIARNFIDYYHSDDVNSSKNSATCKAYGIDVREGGKVTLTNENFPEVYAYFGSPTITANNCVFAGVVDH